MAVDPTPQQSQPQLPGIGPPFTGLYLDRPAHAIPPNGFSACRNVRIYKNRIDATLMGWSIELPYTAFGVTAPGAPVTGANAICGGGIFTLSFNAYQYLIIANQTDLYAFSTGSAPINYTNPAGALIFITPTYTTGTVGTGGVSSTTVTGSSTHWNTAMDSGTGYYRHNARINDYISFGATTVNSPTATWYQITAVNSDTSLTIATAATVTNGTSYTLRQCMANNTSSHRVNFETYPNAAALGADFTDTGDLCLMCNYGGVATWQQHNGADPMVYWNPKNLTATYLTAGNFISASGFINCRTLRRFSNVMIYGALLPPTPNTFTAILGTEMASSDNGDPRTFSSGIAFQGVVSDGAEPIAYLGILGNALMLYTGSQGGVGGSTGVNTAATATGVCVSASFVGLPTVWQFQTVIRNRGPIGASLVAEFTDRHQFIGADGEYRYNGMFLQVMNDHIWRSLLNQPSVQLLSSAFRVYAPGQGEVWWVFPDPGEPSPATFSVYTEHYMEQANSYLFKPYTVRDGFYFDPVAPTSPVNFTTFLGSNVSESVFGGDYNGPILGDALGNILLFFGNDTQQNSSGSVDFVRTFTLGARVMAGERSRGLVKRIYPFIETASLNQNTATTITVTITLGDRIGGRTTITDTQSYVYLNPSGSLPVEPTNRFTTHYRRGRVGSLTISSGIAGSIGHPFICDGYDWDLPGRGSAGTGGQR